MNAIRRRWMRASLALLAGLAANGAGAQGVDTSEWVCEFCPFESGHRGDYEAGATNADEDSAYFGNATGYDEKGVYANVDGQGSFSSDRQQIRWTFEDIGLSSRSAQLYGGSAGRYGYTVAYRELPRRQFLTTQTIFAQPDDTSLALPGGFVRAPLTTGFTQLDASLGARSIESDRRMFDIGGQFLALDNWLVSADYRRQTNDGLKTYGGSSFTNASLLPMPFDYVTDEVDIGIRYTRGGGFVALRWYLSDFDNQNADLTWETPFTSAAGAEAPQLAQAPDSRFQQLGLSGGYAFPAIRTRLSASVSVGEIEQTAALLAYTTNPNLAPPPLPRSTLDGSIDTTTYALSLQSRPVPKGRIRLSYRYDERDNKTPVALWERVIVDSVLSGDAEPNIPYSFERALLTLRGDYDVLPNLEVSAGYERRELDRDLQEVAEQDEDTGWGRVRWQVLPWLGADVRAGTSKRDVDRYDESVGALFGQNPLMRKYNLAYRFREFAELKIRLTPASVPLSLSFDGRYADDDYTRSQLGLTSGEEVFLGADLSWATTERTSVYLNYGQDRIKSNQRGSETFAAPDWTAANDDEFVTLGAGFHVRELGDRADVRLDYVHSDGSSAIRVDSAAGLPDPFPDLDTKLDQLRLRVVYRQSDRLDINLDLSYQQFEAEDWALEGVAPATIPNVLSLGAQAYDDELLLIGLSFQYRLGQDSGS